MSRVNRPKRMNDTLSVRLPSSERRTYERLCISLGEPAIGVSDLARLSIRMTSDALRELQIEVTTTLERRHGPAAVQLMMYAIVNALLRGPGTHLTVHLFDPKGPSGWCWHLWAVSEGLMLRWGVSRPCHLGTTFAAAMGCQAVDSTEDFPRRFIDWATDHKIGKSYAFGLPL